VSSPYHMLRLKLLCDKHLKEAKIYFVPVEKSNFYARGRRISVQQIRGIAYEYAAILYYMLKDYV